MDHMSQITAPRSSSCVCCLEMICKFLTFGVINPTLGISEFPSSMPQKKYLKSIYKGLFGGGIQPQFPVFPI